MKVKNMLGRSGRAVPNQFIIEGVPAGTYNAEGEKIPSGDAFQSYASIIAFRDFTGKVWIDRYKWDFSRTTGKYRNAFLGETTEETRRKIKSGEYTLVNFND